MGLYWKKRFAVLWSVLILLAWAVGGCGRADSEDSVEGMDQSGNGSAVETERGEDPTETSQADSQQDAGSEEKDKTNGQEGASGITTLSALAVDGTQLVDSQGNPVQLKGISTHGLAWFPGYVNADCFRQLKEDWGIDVIRLAMYTGEGGGYCTGGDKDGLKTLVRDGVKYATDCGLYVIIDWHILSDSNPNTYIEESKTFFAEMSREYADYTNVLYEICNEPNGGTSWSDVKSYAEQVIDVIRENDKDGIILVGTPNWCQYVEQAAADPIKDRENIMYTLHFYAATHQDSLRKAMVNAIESGLPIFVSEYGICDASGNGAIDLNQADQWVSVMDQYKVSYVAWNLSNKSETSALIKSSCNKLSGFKAEDLSDSGRWLYSLLTGKNADQAGSTWTGGSFFGGTGNTAAGGNSGQGGQGGSAQTAKTLTTADGLEISASVVNSWEQDGLSCFQYVLTVTNSTDTACTDWTVELIFNGEFTLDSGWNGSYQAEGNKLTITSMDYNGAIPAGSSVGDVGFIVRGKKDLGL